MPAHFSGNWLSRLSRLSLFPHCRARVFCASRPTRGPEPGPSKADGADRLSRPSGRAKIRTLSTGWTTPGRKGADWADRLSRPRGVKGFEDFGDDQRVRGLGPRGGQGSGIGLGRPKGSRTRVHEGRSGRQF